MATQTEQIRIRVPARRAKKVRAILEKLGTDTGNLVNMLFAQVEQQKGIPFLITERDIETLEILNDPEAMKAIRGARSGKKVRLYSLEEAFGE